MSLFLCLNAKQLWEAPGLAGQDSWVLLRKWDCMSEHISIYCVCPCVRTLCEQRSHLIYPPWCKGWWLPAQLNAMQMLPLPSSCQSCRLWHSQHATGAFTASVIFTKWEITLACPSRPWRLNSKIPIIPKFCEVKTSHCVRGTIKKTKLMERMWSDAWVVKEVSHSHSTASLWWCDLLEWQQQLSSLIPAPLSHETALY